MKLQAVVRYLIFILNLFFALFGLLTIVFACIAKSNSKNQIGFSNLNISNLSILFIVIGCFIFLLACLGCCSIIESSQGLMLTYVVMVILLILCQAASTMMLYNEKTKLHPLEVKKTMKDNMKTKSEQWNSIQKKLKCCGVVNYRDWRKVPTSCYCENNKRHKCIVSKKGSWRKTYFKNGCYNVLASELHDAKTATQVVTFLALVVELTQVVLVWYYAQDIRRINNFDLE